MEPAKPIEVCHATVKLNEAPSDQSGDADTSIPVVSPEATIVCGTLALKVALHQGNSADGSRGGTTGENYCSIVRETTGKHCPNRTQRELVWSQNGEPWQLYYGP